MEENVTDNCEHTELSTELAPLNSLPQEIGGAIAGTVGILLLTALTLTVLVICHKKGIPLLPWLPPPPAKGQKSPTCSLVHCRRPFYYSLSAGFEYDVFLSFADEDRDFVQKTLHEPLARRSYRVLFHLSDFIAGMTIEDNIIRAVNISRVVIFVCSKHFSKSSFCQTELKYAMESHYGQYQGRYRRVIPIVIGGECPTQLNTFRIRPIRAPSDIWDYNEGSIMDLIKTLKLGKLLSEILK